MDTGSCTTKPLTVYILRHGERADLVAGPHGNTEGGLLHRPYDPEITAEGKLAAATRGRELAHVPFDVVAISPFLRCVQTAGSFLQGYEGHSCHRAGKVYVEWGLAEVFSAAVIRGTEPTAPPEGITLPPEQLSREYCPWIDPQAPSLEPTPRWGETYGGPHTAAHRRYAATLDHLCHAYAPPTTTLLLVTHAEAIRAVAHQCAGPVPSEVAYCAYVKLEVDSGQGGWSLVGSSGVTWVGED